MAAAEEKKRKKSVAATIRYLVADKPTYKQPFYITSALLVIMTILFMAVLCLLLSEQSGPILGTVCVNRTDIQNQSHVQEGGEEPEVVVSALTAWF